MIQQGKRVTYWLYYGGNPIGSVRMPEGATPYEVKKKALFDEIAVPLHAPGWCQYVRQAVVRVFPEEG